MDCKTSKFQTPFIRCAMFRRMGDSAITKNFGFYSEKSPKNLALFPAHSKELPWLRWALTRAKRERTFVTKFFPKLFDEMRHGVKVCLYRKGGFPAQTRNREFFWQTARNGK